MTIEQYNNRNKGFTLMEVIVAIFIITTGAVGILSLVSQTIGSVTISSQRLIAAYLAQEGIEIVRNIRDTNWLEQRTNPAISWDEGFGGCDAPGCEGDYTTTSLVDSYDGDFLKIDGGFYNYSSGNNTKFQRAIIISDKEDLDGEPGFDKMTVTVEVYWQTKGKTYQVTAQENLYNWR